VTKAVAVVVSESAIVRVFDDGEIVAEIIPELWLLNRYGSTLGDKESGKSSDENLTVVSKDETDEDDNNDNSD
jgi:hypothetical protein